MSENGLFQRGGRQGIRVDRQREKTGMQEANFFETREMYHEGSALALSLTPFPFSSPFLSYQRERRGNQYMRLLFHYLSTLFTTASASAFVLEYPTIEFLVMSLHSYDIAGYIFRIVAFHRRIGPFANMFCKCVPKKSL